MDIEVLTLIAERGRAGPEPHGDPRRAGVADQRAGAAGRWPSLRRRLSARLFHYEHFLTLVARCARFYARERYDLIHAEAAYPFGAAAVLAARRGPPVVVNIQGADVIALPEHDYGFRRFRLPRRLVGLHAAAGGGGARHLAPSGGICHGTRRGRRAAW